MKIQMLLEQLESGMRTYRYSFECMELGAYDGNGLIVREQYSASYVYDLHRCARLSNKHELLHYV